MIGRTVTERPDPLAGAAMWAPVVNTLRVETTETGPTSTIEYGSVATPDGYRPARDECLLSRPEWRKISGDADHRWPLRPPRAVLNGRRDGSSAAGREPQRQADPAARR